MSAVNRIKVKNTEAEAAPRFGLAEIVQATAVTEDLGDGSTESTTILEIRKPTGTGRLVAIGPAAIAAGGFGEAFTGRPHVRFNGSDPSPGDTLEAKAGQWEAESDGGGTSLPVEGDVRTRGEAPSEFKIVRVVIGEGGGATSSAAQLVRVYENFPGYGWEGITATTSTLRCLPVTYDGDTLTVDTSAEFINAVPIFGPKLTLSDSGCCGEGTSVAAPGLMLTAPRRVASGDAEETAFVVSGSGVAANSTVEVEVYDGTTTKTPASVTVSADGTWTADAIDLTASTALVKSFLRVRARETNIDSVVQAWRSIATTYETATPPANKPFNAPARPDMQTASDTGDRDDDNITDDTTPTFDVMFTEAASDITGPAPILLIDGDEASPGVVGAFDDFDDGPIEPMTAASALSTGVHSVQAALRTIDSGNFDSGTSEPLWITIDPDATGTPSTPNDRYAREGLLLTFGGASFVLPGSCPVVITEAEETKLDA